MRERRTYTSEFKAQMVKLSESGKPRKDIISEYDLTPSPSTETQLCNPLIK
ncbi:hypothetical protein [Bacillus salipaludis]|uniref:Transposase n=1 Tax=Bacillus salipaludis TaxID=2547811 RepID=A0ABW8RBV0_9BACI